MCGVSCFLSSNDPAGEFGALEGGGDGDADDVDGGNAGEDKSVLTGDELHEYLYYEGLQEEHSETALGEP